MTPAEVAAELRQFNEWRLGDEYLPQPDTEQITAAIYAAVEMIDRLEAAEKELAELRSSMKFRTSLIGRTEAERDALRAKITGMEKQEPAALVKWQVGGLAAHLIGDAKAGDLLYALPGAK